MLERQRTSVLRACTAMIALAAVGASVAACGGGSAASGIGTSRAPREPGGIDLSLRTHDGRALELADQRGAPVLLFLFATYDGASLATARDVSRFTRENLDTVVIAVALQPDAETFSAAYVESQEPPYTVAYDPPGRILQGVTDLGAIDSIPTLVMIDARGREVARHTGYVSERMLRRWHDDAVGRGGVVPVDTEPEAEPEPEAGAESESEPETGAETEAEPETGAEAGAGDVIVIEPDDP